MASIVLLPGSDGTGHLFDPLIECADLEFIKVRYPTNETLTYSQLEELARSFLPSGPFVLLGESFSGPIAISIAASNPPGLVGLVLSSSFASNPRKSLRLLSWLLPVLPSRVPIGLPAALLMGRFATRQLKSDLAAAVSSVEPAVLRSRMRAILAVDYRSKLRSIQVPALYLRATEDRVVPLSASEEFERNVVNGKVVSIEAPHFLLQCCPGLAAQELRNFVRVVTMPSNKSLNDDAASGGAR